MKNKSLEILRQPDTVSTAVKVAIVVGIILNLINQGDIIFAGDFEKVNVFKALLTFCVPYSVSSYSTVKAKLAFNIGTEAAVDAHVKCMHCNITEMDLKKSETIPVCPICIEKTDFEMVSK